MGSEDERQHSEEVCAGKRPNFANRRPRSAGRKILGWLEICADGLDYHQRREDPSLPVMLPW